ncbi:hypothetical protein HII12_000084 [Brettanomyces bruxellensis]|uniref:Uncharacterized protein n=1 Tax=Dekkera bruxellensis TaxID=5007 RepID=A0A8H6F132_DEKBR|nr:hypothetical protein HII12_000084 [Brettanomyces bruxellensis]
MLILTVEETNKLRAQVGLSLIPVSGSERSLGAKTGHINRNENDITLNVQGRRSGCREISVEETNRLRNIVGLKPLSSGGLHETEVPNGRDKSDNIIQIKKKLHKITSELKVSDQIAKGGIVERTSPNTNTQDEAKWLESLGKGDVRITDTKAGIVKDSSDNKIIRSSKSLANLNSPNEPSRKSANLNDNNKGVTRKKRKKFMVILDDDEIETVHSDYLKPKRMKRLKKKTRDGFRNQEKFVIFPERLKNVELVNEDVGNEDDEDIRKSMDSFRKNVLTQMAPRDIQKKKAIQQNDKTQTRGVGLEINEEIDFLNKFDYEKNVQMKGNRRQELNTDTSFDDHSKLGPADTNVVKRDISKIMDKGLNEISTLGIGAMVDALKDATPKRNPRQIKSIWFIQMIVAKY